MSIEALALDVIRVDGGTQARGSLNTEWVDELASHLVDGNGALDAVTVFYDGAAYWLADGFHRVAAYRKAERSIIRAEVNAGTRRDAVLFACGANAKHGLRRTNADKRRAVETLLRDAEWSGWSDNEVAKRCGVSQPFVGKVRGEASTYNGYKSDNAPTERIGADGRTINTANIGRKSAPTVEQSAPSPVSAPPPVSAQRVEAPAAPVRPVAAPPPAPAPVERPQSPPPAPAFARVAPPTTEPVAREAAPVDARGVEVPERLRSTWCAFADHSAAIEAAALPLRRAIEAMLADTSRLNADAGKSVARGPWHALREFAGQPLDVLRHNARELAPRYLCEDCGGNDIGCRYCDGAGWMPTAQVKALEVSAAKTAAARVKAGVAS